MATLNDLHGGLMIEQQISVGRFASAPDLLGPLIPIVSKSLLCEMLAIGNGRC